MMFRRDVPLERFYIPGLLGVCDRSAVKPKFCENCCEGWGIKSSDVVIAME